MDDFRKKHPIYTIVMNLLLQGVVTVAFFYFGIAGWLTIALTTANRGVATWLYWLFCIGAFLLSTGFVWKVRIICRVSYAIILMAILAGGGAIFHHWWTKGRFPIVEQRVAWWDYNPFTRGNKLVKVEVPDTFRLDGNDIPKMDGAYALYPVYAALAQAMFPRELAMQKRYVQLNGSDEIYRRLLAGECDMIFALAPSKAQQEDAEKAGLVYEMTPFCRDAFVFYVNAKNPVDGLSTEEIKGIYSGQITNWRQISPKNNAKIIAFQRNEGSGSQTTLQRLMGDTPIMPPLKEDRVGGMGEIINDTANYRNNRSALGFSFRYYSMDLLRNDKIRLLPIDGVAPTVENIRNETYPHVATAYVVTVRPRTDNIRRIVDFLLSPAGQELVEKTGYVPVEKP